MISIPLLSTARNLHAKHTSRSPTWLFHGDAYLLYWSLCEIGGFRKYIWVTGSFTRENVQPIMHFAEFVLKTELTSNNPPMNIFKSWNLERSYKYLVWCTDHAHWCKCVIWTVSTGAADGIDPLICQTHVSHESLHVWNTRHPYPIYFSLVLEQARGKYQQLLPAESSGF